MVLKHGWSLIAYSSKTQDTTLPINQCYPFFQMNFICEKCYYYMLILVTGFKYCRMFYHFNMWCWLFLYSKATDGLCQPQFADLWFYCLQLLSFFCQRLEDVGSWTPLNNWRGKKIKLLYATAASALDMTLLCITALLYYSI